MNRFTPAAIEAAEALERAVIGCEISLLDVAIALHQLRVEQIRYRQAQIQLDRQTAQLTT